MEEDPEGFTKLEVVRDDEVSETTVDDVEIIFVVELEYGGRVKKVDDEELDACVLLLLLEIIWLIEAELLVVGFKAMELLDVVDCVLRLLVEFATDETELLVVWIAELEALDDVDPTEELALEDGVWEMLELLVLDALEEGAWEL